MRTMNNSNSTSGCEPPKAYSRGQTVLANTPYALMLLLGAAVLAVGPFDPVWRILAAAAYVGYGMAGTLWIMIFLCPFCHFYSTRQCPCGYGQVAARLVAKQDGARFGEKFKKHIPVIVPLWLIPPVASVFFLRQEFSWPLLALVVAFALNSFIVLPLVSRKNCCTQCPQRDTCPWMGKKQPA
jgi:hypothetical protein